MANREPIGWITVKGKRVPLFEGESKEEAVKNVLGDKAKQIEQNKKEADKKNAQDKEIPIKQIKDKTQRQEAQVQKHLGNIVWNKAIGTDGQAETGREPVKGISIDKFCEIASKIDKKYDYDYETDKTPFMGSYITHYYIMRDKK